MGLERRGMKTGFSLQPFTWGRRKAFGLLCIVCLSTLVAMLAPQKAHAFSCTLPSYITSRHDSGRQNITSHTANQFNRHRDWLVNTFFLRHVLPALQLFTEQMTAVAMHQTLTIGEFFDAKHQLETQRLFQELQVQAHKDYQPSTAFCAFGTNARSLAHAESLGRYNAIAIGQRQLARHLGQVNMAGSREAADDKAARWKQFSEIYCDPQDNNWLAGVANTGLISGGADPICKPKDSRTTDLNRINIDIDYTRALENRRTIDIGRPIDIGSDDEIDTQALGNNLYGHDILFRNISRANIKEADKEKLYMSLRSIAAKRNVAENSFNNIVGLKSIGNVRGYFSNTPVESYKYLAAILVELGIPENEILEYTGDFGSTPENIDFSYYNQLEILAKKIYQNPDFYANLYDKPANVKRISTALKAIELMLDRAIYESQLRQEMSMSVLLSSRLRLGFKDIDKNLQSK